MSASNISQKWYAKWLNRLPERLRTQGALIGLILAAGLLLRAYGYVRNPSLWHDEAALVLNVIHKDFSELLGPLIFTQAAPPLFLWIERAAVLVLGDSTYALRLMPFLASCTALLLFLWVSRRLLPPAAVPWALLLFSFNDHLLWHTCEVKPYSFDVLTATVLLALWLRTRSWPLTRQLLLWTAVAPVMIFLSYPGCFLVGGLMLMLLPQVWLQRRQAGVWLTYGGLALSVGIAFLLLYLGPARTQHNVKLESYWATAFPPWGEGGWAVLVWTVMSTLEGLSYCCMPVGNALAGVLIVGAVSLWRRGARSAVVLLLAPAGLALAAAAIHCYPYSGTRLLVYLTPAVVLLIAAGVPAMLAWLQRRSQLAAAAVVLLLLAPVGIVAHNTIFPYGRSEIAQASRYVLQEQRPGDGVWGNSWEQRDYFRPLGEVYIADEARPDVGMLSRLWLVVVGKTREDREETLRDLAPEGWEWVQRREYYRTTVVLLQSPSSSSDPSERAEVTRPDDLRPDTKE